MDKINCINGCGELVLTNKEKEISFQGYNIKYKSEIYICPICSLEVGTFDQCKQIMNKVMIEYQKILNLDRGK